MHNYRLIAKKGSGAFSQVLTAQDIKTGQYVAIKCMKHQYQSIDQINKLVQIQSLRRLSKNRNIIKLLKILYDQPSGRLALVFQLMDRNIYQWIRGRRHYIPQGTVKQYIHQLLQALDYTHRNQIFHRDVKPENILIKDKILKLADFGSCKHLKASQPHTEYISTRWYRPPQCLLTDGYYTSKMDLWGVGCVFYQILALEPLFPGQNQLDQVHRIHQVLGTPQVEVLEEFQKKASHMEFDFPERAGTGIDGRIPHISPLCRDLIGKLLAYKVEDRISARQALRHPYFKPKKLPEITMRIVSPVNKWKEGDPSDKTTWKLPNIRGVN